MISSSAFIDGVIKFVSMEVLPKMPNGLDKFLGYMAVGAVQKNSAAVFQPYMDMMSTVGILKEGMVDTDLLHDSLINGFSQQPSVTVAGFTFNEGDIAHLMKYLG